MKLTIKMTMKHQNSIWISHKNIRLSTNYTRLLNTEKKKKKDLPLFQSFKFQIIRFNHLISIFFQYNFFMQSTSLSLSKQSRCRRFN